MSKSQTTVSQVNGTCQVSCQMEPPRGMSRRLNKEQKDFALYCARITEHAVFSLCFIIGKRLGLFEVLQRKNGQPASSMEIAKEAKCKERYVREWLNSMVAAGIISASDDGQLYWIPKARLEAFQSRFFKLATQWMDFVTVGADVMDNLTECFKVDGPQGIPYSRYDAFHPVMAFATSNAIQDSTIAAFAKILPIDILKRLENGGSILDVACGSGASTCCWARKFPKANVVGADLSDIVIEKAKELANERRIYNAKFVAADAHAIPSSLSGRFDLVCITNSFHDMAWPEKCLNSMKSALNENGLLLMVEVDFDTNPANNRDDSIKAMFYAVSLFHCMPVSLSFDDGAGLGLACGRQKVTKMLENAGMKIQLVGSGIIPMGYHIFARKGIPSAL